MVNIEFIDTSSMNEDGIRRYVSYLEDVIIDQSDYITTLKEEKESLVTLLGNSAFMTKGILPFGNQV